eukprot:gene1480-869_t
MAKNSNFNNISTVMLLRDELLKRYLIHKHQIITNDRSTKAQDAVTGPAFLITNWHRNSIRLTSESLRRKETPSTTKNEAKLLVTNKKKKR